MLDVFFLLEIDKNYKLTRGGTNYILNWLPAMCNYVPAYQAELGVCLEHSG